ncbi:MAG: hypothetical protein GY761_18290 [Hyphomicrobiales bacterium]|nr:hypothetical protein [Hyphomicrobiales bacterium]
MTALLEHETVGSKLASGITTMTFLNFQIGHPENAMFFPYTSDNDIETRSCQRDNGFVLVENTAEKDRQAILLAAFGGILTIVIATVTLNTYPVAICFVGTHC